MLLQRLFFISCLVVTSVYAPPHETHAKNSARWTHGNHKAKRQSAEFAVAVNLRAKRTDSSLPKQGVSGSKHAKKTRRMVLKRYQVELEGMLDELKASQRLIKAEMAI